MFKFKIFFRLREFENLQSECVAISQLYKNVNELVIEQAPMVDKIEENVEIASIEVEEGTKHLQTALSYKSTMYPLVGGLVGAALLGPLGLVAGLKAGSAASLCGGICGYAGGKFIKKSNTPTSPEASELPELTATDESIENSQQTIAR
jgi:syntaxin 17